jgi:protein-S-isoprenylcysteine O-methyltransferase Ste14
MTLAPSAAFVDVLLLVWMGYGGWISFRTWRHKGNEDEGSGAVFGMGIFVPFVIAFLLRRAGIGLLTPQTAEVLAWVGGSLMLVGIVVWMRAIATLGELFSVSVYVGEDHRLVDGGIFSRVRHPAYAGMLTTLLGYGVASGDWVAAIAFVAVPFAAFSYRIAVEERVLVRHLGRPYEEYMTRTKRLIPFIY